MKQEWTAPTLKTFGTVEEITQQNSAKSFGTKDGLGFSPESPIISAS